ncbi:MAG TPA: DNA alkylation repair protein [Acidobacteriota bacterium]|nr:DNA alkylation repair protein [Acidobacteriota bacterium]
MDTQSEHESLVAQLEQRVDLEYQAGSSMVIKTQLQVRGVRVSDLRQIARRWSLEHRDACWEAVLELIESLWQAPSQEERALAILLLQRHSGRIPSLDWELFDRWRKDLDNWGLTDALATIVFGPWIAADYSVRGARLWSLIEDSSVWSRRLALVATVPLNRVPSTAIPETTLALIDRVASEREPMITKAVSWALRELIRVDRASVESYLEENRTRLARLVLREVGNKLRTGLKSGKAKSD